MEDTKKDASDLYRLAFLLTGRPDISIDVASDTVVSQYKGNAFFSDWMQAWSRRIVVAKALGAVRHEVAESVRRVKSARADRSEPISQGWTLRPDTTKAEVEEALLDLDLFPRGSRPFIDLRTGADRRCGHSPRRRYRSGQESAGDRPR